MWMIDQFFLKLFIAFCMLMTPLYWFLYMLILQKLILFFAQSVVNNIASWFTANWLVLNVTKIHAMLFSLAARIAYYSPSLYINDAPITYHSSVKFPACLIESKLKWNKKNNYLCGRINNSFAMVRFGRFLYQ